MKTTQPTTIVRILATLALPGVLLALGAVRAPAQNMIANGDFTANAAGYVVWPGYMDPPGAGNPTAISGWINYLATAMGVNGAATSVGNPFGPTINANHTYAFLQGMGLLGQYLPASYTTNAQYRLEFDVAGRMGEVNVPFQVVIGETADHFTTGSLLADPGAFKHYAYTFTSPAVFDGGFGGPSLRLWNLTGGGEAINFANVSLVPLPLPGRLPLLTDSYNSADSSNLNADLSRQSGLLAPVSYIAGFSPPDAIEIKDNALTATLADTGGDHSFIVAPVQDFIGYEVNRSFRVECDIAVQATTGPTHHIWAGVSVRGVNPGMGVTAPDSFSMYVRPDGGFEVFDGAPPAIAGGGGGSLNGLTNYHVVIDVTNDVVRIKVNDMPVPFYGGGYSHTIVNATSGNHVAFSSFALAVAAPTAVKYDNLVVSVPLVPAPAPTLLNPAYDPGTSTASFQFNSVAQGFYVVESKVNLDDPVWTKVSTIFGTGGLENVSVPSPAGSGYFRLRVPQP